MAIGKFFDRNHFKYPSALRAMPHIEGRRDNHASEPHCFPQ